MLDLRWNVYMTYIYMCSNAHLTKFYWDTRNRIVQKDLFPYNCKELSLSRLFLFQWFVLGDPVGGWWFWTDSECSNRDLKQTWGSKVGLNRFAILCGWQLQLHQGMFTPGLACPRRRISENSWMAFMSAPMVSRRTAKKGEILRWKLEAGGWKHT